MKRLRWRYMQEECVWSVQFEDGSVWKVYDPMSWLADMRFELWGEAIIA
jgi:hypothetical protein